MSYLDFTFHFHLTLFNIRLLNLIEYMFLIIHHECSGDILFYVLKICWQRSLDIFAAYISNDLRTPSHFPRWISVFFIEIQFAYNEHQPTVTIHHLRSSFLHRRKWIIWFEKTLFEAKTWQSMFSDMFLNLFVVGVVCLIWLLPKRKLLIVLNIIDQHLFVHKYQDKKDMNPAKNLN